MIGGVVGVELGVGLRVRLGVAGNSLGDASCSIFVGEKNFLLAELFGGSLTGDTSLTTSIARAISE